MKTLLLTIVLLFGSKVQAQLPDGSVAPDFTLMDIVDSNTYNLYDYLDSGKTCFVEIFAAHCPGCWAYHQAETLKNLYNSYGPNGSDEIMVFALEYDEYNFYDAFIGIGPNWVTAGNWLAGTPYPIFQVEGADRSVFTDYNVTAYPLVFMVCPNKRLKRVSTSLTAQQLHSGLSDCALLSIDEQNFGGKVFIDGNKNLVIEKHQNVQSVTITNLQGQLIKTINEISGEATSLGDLKTGVYFFRINTTSGTELKRLPVQN